MKKIFTIIIFLGLITTSLAEKTSFFDEAKILFEQEKYDESKFLFQRNIVYNPKSAASALSDGSSLHGHQSLLPYGSDNVHT